MKFELKAFRDDKAQPVALEIVTDHYRKPAEELAAKHHLGAALFTEPITNTLMYENGLIYISPITEP